MSGGRLIPPAVDEELYHYWVEPNPYLWEHHYSEEEKQIRAERIRRYRRPWPRFVRWVRGLRWELHDHFYPECDRYNDD